MHKRLEYSVMPPRKLYRQESDRHSKSNSPQLMSAQPSAEKTQRQRHLAEQIESIDHIYLQNEKYHCLYFRSDVEQRPIGYLKSVIGLCQWLTAP
jgi:hypothetical protein